MNKPYILPFIVLTILSFADFGLTMFIVGNDYALETNTVLRWVLEQSGYYGMFFVKLIPVLFLGLIIWFNKLKRTFIIDLGFISSIFIYLIIVAIGLIVIISQMMV